MNGRLLTTLLLFAAKVLPADCGYAPVSSSSMPDWVKYESAIPLSNTGSYINRYMGSGVDKTAAENDARDKIKRNMEKKYADYRIEREWSGQCSVDNFVVYLLAQTIPYGGKFDDSLNYGTEEEAKREPPRLKPLVPGMAQFYKGHNALGWFFAVSEPALLLSGLYLKFFKAENENMDKVSNILIGSAIGIYIINIITGFALPSHSEISMAPVACTAPFAKGSFSTGLQIFWNFETRR